MSEGSSLCTVHSPTIYAVKQVSLAQNVAIWKEQMDTCHEVNCFSSDLQKSVI